MEILSDATFKGNVSIDGQLYANCVSTSASVSIDGQLSAGGISTSGAFSVNKDNSGRPYPLIEINKLYSGNNYSLYVDGSEWVQGRVIINGYLEINGSSISNWTDLNSILDFAPKSLSCTVSSLCTTVSSNTTKINSLRTKVDGIQSNTKHVFGNPTLPAGCTKFYFVNNVMSAEGDDGNKHYKFILNNWYDPVSSVQVFKGGTGSTNIVNEEVQMDVKQYTIRCSTYGSKRYFEGTLTSNTSGYDESEFLLVFDDFGVMCTTSIVPQ